MEILRLVFRVVMHLDLENLDFLTKDDLRVLTAVEMGGRNHELVPVNLIESIANLKQRGAASVIIKVLHKHKLVFHDSLPYHGYRLTSNGYDCLAVHALKERGVLGAVGRRVGVGKESDIHEAFSPDYEEEDEDGEEADGEYVLKVHRLGRTSFRNVKNTRDYLKKRKTSNWMYLSRLAAEKEFQYATALHSRGFPVPRPIAWNRHAILMDKIHGQPLYKVEFSDFTEEEALTMLKTMYKIIMDLAAIGLIHGDLNEFNLMADSDAKVYVIDFPQMVAMDHVNAEFYFNRDLDGVRSFFQKKFGVDYDVDVPTFSAAYALFLQTRDAASPVVTTGEESDDDDDDADASPCSA